MKALILHGTDNDHTGNWFPWLKTELEKLGLEVWVPDLPESKKPNVHRYTDFLLNQGWDFEGCLVIGHSAGAVEILDLLQHLPAKQKINTAILVAVFKGDLGWEVLADLKDVNYDYEKIKQNTQQSIIIHSDDDPYCSLVDAREIAQKIEADMIVMSGMKHFSLGTDKRFTEFPKLLEIIKQKVL